MHKVSYYDDGQKRTHLDEYYSKNFGKTSKSSDQEVYFQINALGHKTLVFRTPKCPKSWKSQSRYEFTTTRLTSIFLAVCSTV